MARTTDRTQLKFDKLEHEIEKLREDERQEGFGEFSDVSAK